MNMDLSYHQPKRAHFKAVESGSFGTVEIGEYPMAICLMITGTRSENLQFLYQLAQAAEAAIKYEILKGATNE
jgi:hypothetical protein